MNAVDQYWPALPLEEWEATYRTLHMWTQIVGKILLRLTPLENHFWNVALDVTTRGLTTGPIPYRGGAFELQFDFVSLAAMPALQALAGDGCDPVLAS